MIYTSGTTGLPKGAMISHRNMLFKAACAATVYGFKPKDVFLSVMPIYHIAGLLAGVSVPIYAGAQFVLLPQFEPELAMQEIERNECTIAYTVTPMNAAILAHPKHEDYALNSLRLNMCSSFGIPITEELSGKWEKLTRGCRLFESSFGMSETCGFDTFMPLSRIKFGTVGIPVYDCEIKIMDEETGSAEMPTGESGEILIRNSGVFQEYWNRPEATSEALRDGWLRTGDIGNLDEEGYLTFLGRKKEMIKSSGYSVFPEEVELYLLKHPAVQAVAVIGVSDVQRGEAVKAFVVLRPDFRGKVTEEEIIQWAKEKITYYKCPRIVEFRTELPTSGTGKVLRRLLADEAPGKI
ncbi:MAG: class I adenylate-forming enzyme family protein [Desulfitobacteriaceae bacterium]